MINHRLMISFNYFKSLEIPESGGKMEALMLMIVIVSEADNQATLLYYLCLCGSWNGESGHPEIHAIKNIFLFLFKLFMKEKTANVCLFQLLKYKN